MTYETFADLQWIWKGSKNPFQYLSLGGQNLNLHQVLDTVCSDQLAINGFDQEGLEILVKQYGSDIRYLVLLRCERIRDLTSLGSLDRLEFLQISGNQLVDKLWDMRGNQGLAGLCLNDFTRLHSLEGVQHAPALRHLHFGNAVWEAATLKDVEPLRDTALESFSFDGKRIDSIDLTFFAGMPELKRLDFTSNLFQTEEIAALVACAPWLEGKSLRPYCQFFNTVPGEKDVLIVGKRKPWLHSDSDAARIQAYADRFNDLVEKVRKGMRPNEIMKKEGHI